MCKKPKDFLRIAILVSFFVCFVPFSSFAVVDSAEVSFNPNISYILTGGAVTKFSVDVVVDENADSLVQCEIYLRCNRNVLAIDSVSKGSIWQGAGGMVWGTFDIEPIDSNQVFFYYGIVGADLYVNGPGVLARVYFRTRGSGESDLIFPPDSVILRGLDHPILPSKTKNGKVYVDFPPTSFNLLSPTSGANLFYCVGDNHLFDWENSTTPYPANPIHYSLSYGTSQVFDPGSTTIISGLSVSQYQVSAGSFADGSIIYWKVKAYDSHGFETWSNQLDWSFSVFLDEFPPPQPTMNGVMVGSGKITINWTDVEGERSYNIYREGADLIGTVGANITSFDYLDPPTGSEYCYSVSAENNCGESDLSSEPACTVIYLAAGRVESHGGAPVPGVMVRLVGNPGSKSFALEDSTSTDGSGNYAFKLPAGDYKVFRDSTVPGAWLVFSLEKDTTNLILLEPGTDVESSNHEEGVISGYSLLQNYPNPFNPSTCIEFDLPKTCQVKLEIYNILGNRVKTLFNNKLTAGRKSVTWDGKDEQGKEVTSGIYFYRLRTDEFTWTKRMLLLR